jgi:hypothetical protein
MKGWDTKTEKPPPHFDNLPAITSFSIKSPTPCGPGSLFRLLDHSTFRKPQRSKYLPFKKKHSLQLVFSLVKTVGKSEEMLAYIGISCQVKKAMDGMNGRDAP